ncbi:DNA polymerase III subunit alpha [Virgibacillus sp. YIM 98842]|uniref:DNA polymerase III subunit alpha n=1 Tax=Virgibacillus sp. YIM 98842 TaxID=2663533 RepID=UPI0013DA844A|nr:DNA polymerase III subunit alpha [Virgibacillus sp. YIM 98842]
MSFTHLQVRSAYSLMKSTIQIDKLIDQAKELNFDALALTDEQVLYGAIPFYRACVNNGIKPIIGLTVNLEEQHNQQETCILLAKNNAGYKELVNISTYLNKNEKAFLEWEELKINAENLVAIFPLTDNLKNILATKENDAFRSYADKRQQAFPDWYVGVSSHEMKQEKDLLEKLKTVSGKHGVKFTAIQDVRYLNHQDYMAYDCLQAMKQGITWEGKRKTASGPEHHLASTEEVKEAFSVWPQLLEETERIKDRCNITFDFNRRRLPSFPVPGGLDAYEYLRKKCMENLEVRYVKITPEITERLEYELEVIRSMQFSDYFLIVADFIHFAKEHSIVVGPGRGSSAGSLVAYTLGITDVDPIKYDLLFERFLNPERLTMPDIDVDFSDIRRDEVIEYVRKKYGEAHVAQIITFGTFAARSIIRELIKTLAIDKEDANFILKQAASFPNKRIPEMVKAFDGDVKVYIKQSRKLKMLLSIAAKLEGIPRHISTHAAGIVITEKPLVEYVPLTIGANESNLTQFSMNDLEALGLLKIDLLGLRNLTFLEKTVQSIYFSTKKKIALHELPAADEKTFQLLRSGKTNGIFQLESQGMQNVLKQLKPTEFEDVVAVNALYRPGPMENIPVYIKRKHEQESVSYPHPALAPILGKTYGVLVYQEQIIQIAYRMAGFTLAEADLLRRAVSKKQQAVMDDQKEKFIEGCIQNGYEKRIGEEIFAWIVKFSNYGFPRSHAVAYSKISYQLAYLKAHYPAHFFAELLSSVANQHDKIQLYRREIKELNIPFKPPSINKSFGKYSVEDHGIRMGLLSIKGIGNKAIQEILRVRKNGRYRNLSDFCLRVSSSIVNRQTIELLIMAGAFDALHPNRASLLASIDPAIEQGELFREFQDQPNLFGDQLELETSYVDIEDFSDMKKLADEKDLLGIYISSHPLERYRAKLRKNGYITMSHAKYRTAGKEQKSTAIIDKVKTIRTKRGDPMAFLTLSDETDEMEAVVFPDLFRNTKQMLEEENLIMVQGKPEKRNNRMQWILSKIQPFEAAQLEKNTKQRLFIKLPEHEQEQSLNFIKQTAYQHPGETPIILFDETTRKTYQLKEEYFIRPAAECLLALRKHFGKDAVVLQKEKE